MKMIPAFTPSEIVALADAGQWPPADNPPYIALLAPTPADEAHKYHALDLLLAYGIETDGDVFFHPYYEEAPPAPPAEVTEWRGEALTEKLRELLGPGNTVMLVIEDDEDTPMPAGNEPLTQHLIEQVARSGGSVIFTQGGQGGEG